MSTIVRNRRLGDICTVRKGTTITEKETSFGDVPVVAGGMSPSYFHDRANRGVGAVTVSASGANAGFVNYWDIPIWASDCTTVEPIDPENVEATYIFHLLKSLEKTVISSLRRGAAQPHVYPKDIQEIVIPLPSIKEQRRIASILDAADALRSKRRQAIEKLETLTQSIFAHMFRGLAEDPARCVPLAELIRPEDRLNYGVVQPGENSPDGIPMIRIGDLVDGRVEHGAIKHIARDVDAQYSRSRLVGDEILLSCVGSTGVVALISLKEAGWNIARAIARIPLADSIDRHFVAAFLSSEIAQRYFDNELRTVSQPTLNIKQIKQIPVPVPSSAAQVEFGRRAKNISDMRDRYRTHEQLFESLFVSLQRRAFRGEL